MSDTQPSPIQKSDMPPDLTPAARQRLINSLWLAGKQALLMIGKPLRSYSESSQDRNTSILADVFMAGANAIDKRIRT